MGGEEGERLADRHVEHVGDRFALDLHFQYLGAETAAVAIRAAQINVGQKLHLDVFKTIAAAGRTAPVAGIEAEGAVSVLTFACQRRFRVEIADRFEGADVAGRIRARGAADRCLIDHHYVAD